MTGWGGGSDDAPERTAPPLVALTVARLWAVSRVIVVAMPGTGMGPNMKAASVPNLDTKLSGIPIVLGGSAPPVWPEEKS